MGGGQRGGVQVWSRVARCGGRGQKAGGTGGQASNPKRFAAPQLQDAAPAHGCAWGTRHTHEQRVAAWARRQVPAQRKGAVAGKGPFTMRNCAAANPKARSPVHPARPGPRDAVQVGGKRWCGGRVCPTRAGAGAATGCRRLPRSGTAGKPNPPCDGGPQASRLPQGSRMGSPASRLPQPGCAMGWMQPAGCGAPQPDVQARAAGAAAAANPGSTASCTRPALSLRVEHKFIGEGFGAREASGATTRGFAPARDSPPSPCARHRPGFVAPTTCYDWMGAPGMRQQPASGVGGQGAVARGMPPSPGPAGHSRGLWAMRSRPGGAHTCAHALPDIRGGGRRRSGSPLSATGAGARGGVNEMRTTQDRVLGRWTQSGNPLPKQSAGLQTALRAPQRAAGMGATTPPRSSHACRPAGLGLGLCSGECSKAGGLPWALNYGHFKRRSRDVSAARAASPAAPLS